MLRRRALTIVVAVALGSGVGCERSKHGAGADDRAQAQAQPSAPDFSTEPTAAKLAALIAAGEEAYLDHSCDSCHAIEGRGGSRGPSFVGLYSTRARFADGGQAERDEAYLYESIVDPAAQLVEGWPPNSMPLAPIDDDEAVALVYYIRSLADAD